MLGDPTTDGIVTNASAVYFQEDFQGQPRRSSRSQSTSHLRLLRAALARNQDLLRNAGSLAATTGVTSVLGFAYWIYAARFFAPEAVGYATAAIATMTLLGTIGVFGLGTMLIGELPQGGNRGGLIMASIIASFMASIVLAFGFALVSLSFGSHFVEISGNIWRMAVFSIGVALSAATMVFDDAAIGLMRGGLQLSRNATVSVAKMLALPVSAFLIHDVFGLGIMLSWVLGTAVSLIPTAINIKRGGSKILYRPDWATFRKLGKVTLAHNWLNLAITVPTKLVPVLVATMVAPTSNAAYYVAAMIASFLAMVPMHLSTVLFAVASAAPEKISEKLRFVLRTALVIGIPVGLAMGISAHFVLSVFGSSYASLATGPLWIMIAGYIPGLPSAVYIAVCRATGKVNQATILLSTFAVLQMLSVVVGGKLDGLYGLSYGQLAVSIIEAFITAPLVLRVAFGSVPVPAAVDRTTSGQAHLGPTERAEELRQRQEAGIDALTLLATSVAIDDRPPSPGTAPSGVMIKPLPNGTKGRPDPNDAAFQRRQEDGVAALIEIADYADRFQHAPPDG
jgi:O-antigen/teichoic acid export membrane protein